MTDQLTPFDEILSPEQLAAHLRAALGKTYKITAPGAFVNKRKQPIVIICPLQAIKASMMEALAAVGASVYRGEKAHECWLRIADVSEARRLAPSMIDQIQKHLPDWQKLEEDQAKAKAAQHADKVRGAWSENTILGTPHAEPAGRTDQPSSSNALRLDKLKS